MNQDKSIEGGAAVTIIAAIAHWIVELTPLLQAISFAVAIIVGSLTIARMFYRFAVWVHGISR